MRFTTSAHLGANCFHGSTLAKAIEEKEKRMTNPNQELIALGTANIVAPYFKPTLQQEGFRAQQ